jgi:hypothetical protein
MDTNQTFPLQEVIDDLIDVDKSLTAPLMKLNYFARLVKNEPLLAYTTRELEGYRTVDDSEIPDYRKTPGTIYLDFYSMGATATYPVSPSILEEPEFDGHFQYLVFREGIATIEQMIKDREKGDSKDQYLEHPFPIQLLPSFEKGIKKRNPKMPIKITGGRMLGNAYKLMEILPVVRTRLMSFTMEVAEQFGVKIEISSFNKQKDTNNQTIYHIMNKTEITNTGDGNVVNTGDNAIQSANIKINKGDWNALRKTLLHHGIDESEVNDLRAIVDNEKPDGDKVGPKALDWILKVSGKAIQGVGKIATGVSSALLASLIKGYFGI